MSVSAPMATGSSSSTTLTPCSESSDFSLATDDDLHSSEPQLFAASGRSTKPPVSKSSFLRRPIALSKALSPSIGNGNCSPKTARRQRPSKLALVSQYAQEGNGQGDPGGTGPAGSATSSPIMARASSATRKQTSSGRGYFSPCSLEDGLEASPRKRAIQTASSAGTAISGKASEVSLKARQKRSRRLKKTPAQNNSASQDCGPKDDQAALLASSNSSYCEQSAGLSSELGTIDPELFAIISHTRELGLLAQKSRTFVLTQRHLGGGAGVGKLFWVDIGPQECSCHESSSSSAPRWRPCSHLLFVMIRLLGLAADDMRLAASHLSDVEADFLLRDFNLRWRGSSSSSGGGGGGGSELNSASACPICLVDDGCLRQDSSCITTCSRDCSRNLMHSTCLSWWRETVPAASSFGAGCPLCADVTAMLEEAASSSPTRKVSAPAKLVPQPSRTPSTINTTLSELGDLREDLWGTLEVGGPPEEIPLPQTEPLSGKHWSAVNSWIAVIGKDLVTCLLSREWSLREVALRRLAREIANYFKACSFQDALSERTDRLWKTCADVIAKTIDDKVFKVYVSAVRCLRTLLAFTYIHDELHELAVLAALRPSLQGILLKCADGNRRLAEFSVDTVLEICKGRAGIMAMGKMLTEEQCGLSFGLDYVIQTILEDRDPHKSSWQFFLGRLTILQRLMVDFEAEFSLSNLPSEHCREAPSCERLLRIADYSFAHLMSNHVNVNKLARSVFVQCACLASSQAQIFATLWKGLAGVDQTLQLRMMRKIKAAVKELPAFSSNYVQLDKIFFYEEPLSRTSAAAAAAAAAGGGGVAAGSGGGGGSGRPVLNRSTSHSPSRQWPAFSERDHSSSPTRLLKAKRMANISSLKKTKYRMKQKLKSVCKDRLEDKEREISPDLLLPPPPPQLLSEEIGNLLRGEQQLADVATGNCPTVANLVSSSSPSLYTGAAEWIESNLETPDLAPVQAPFFPHGCYREGIDWTRGLLLGSGAFSSCYQARDVRTGSLMAVKQITMTRSDPSERDKVLSMMRDEVSILSGLDHPHVLRLFGVTTEETHLNVFVEWMAGGSVASLLDKHGVFTEMVMLKYLIQVLLALDYLHNVGILHRDLKGANLLVDSSGHHLRVGDFGAAARMASFMSIPGEFQGQLQGTIAFMAPEVLRGESYGRSCDIWSVGCCVIEMATTRPPWNGLDISNHLALIFKVGCSPEPPCVPETLSPELRDFTLCCLELRPERRPSAKQLLSHPILSGF